MNGETDQELATKKHKSRKSKFVFVLLVPFRG
jgi:hypothetical protein